VGKVSYYSRWEDCFPSLYSMKIGEGYKGVTRIQDPFSLIGEVDCWMFPDNTFGGFQVDLEKRGERVWGPRHGHDIEDFKEAFREYCKEINVPIVPYEIAIGMTDLRKKLEGKKNVWLKVDLIRGNFETQNVESLELCEPYLKKIEHDLGPWSETQRIIIEDDYPDSVEVAFDLWTIDGKFPTKAIFGLEKKGEFYCCHTMDYNDLPWQIQELNEKFAPLLAEYKSRTNFPVEIRINKKGEYAALDPCMREGHPVFATKMTMIKNLPDVFHYGAEGEMVEPEFVEEDSWGMELVVFSSWAEKEPKAVYVPPEYRDSVFLRYAAEVDGIPWVLPQLMPNSTLGSIASTDKSWERCKEKILEVKDEIKGGGVDSYDDAFDKFKASWEKLKEYGVMNLPKIN
jgi:hypothetical protein